MEERLYWSRLNTALSSFCLKQSKKQFEKGNTLVNSAVGDDLEWCSSQTLLFMTADLFTTHHKLTELETTLKGSEHREQTLRKKIDETLERSSKDRERDEQIISNLKHQLHIARMNENHRYSNHGDYGINSNNNPNQIEMPSAFHNVPFENNISSQMNNHMNNSNNILSKVNMNNSNNNGHNNGSNYYHHNHENLRNGSGNHFQQNHHNL